MIVRNRSIRSLATALTLASTMTLAGCETIYVKSHGNDAAGGGGGGGGGGSQPDSTSAGPGGLPVCSSLPTCSDADSDAANDCVSCAAQGQCAPQLAACNASQDCLDYWDCIDGCTTDACYDSCYGAHPSGGGTFDEFAVCLICDSCYATCDGAGSGCQCKSQGSACSSTAECCDSVCSKGVCSGGSDKSCKGSALGCSYRDYESECKLGCTWEKDCTGSADGCAGYFSKANCEHQDGCYYEGFYPDGYCTGIATHCSDYSEEYACEHQYGCDWETGCAGTPKSCPSLGETDCGKQPGCYWE
jgi:hypothetical protein